MDMRYGFPSVSRMLAILEELSAARFNTFLLEYENRFPFEAYPDIADPAHFTPPICGGFRSGPPPYISS